MFLPYLLVVVDLEHELLLMSKMVIGVILSYIQCYVTHCVVYYT